DPGLRDPGLSEAASIVARIAAVRATILAYQRSFARRPGGAVLDGRDIGTVVCPDADVKLFVTASAEVRAERRYRERLDRGERVSFAAVLEDISRRDARDAGRDVSPMRPAEDAFLLDTSNLDIEAAFDTAVGVIARTIAQRGRA
ncbi:MAG: (d)CMP kinase, partial [Hyphomicrobiaceae bacterium]|nr:(d)CMP kinase [Hyphomicrobiaceae bacterium]